MAAVSCVTSVCPMDWQAECLDSEMARTGASSPYYGSTATALRPTLSTEKATVGNYSNSDLVSDLCQVWVVAKKSLQLKAVDLTLKS